MDLQLWLFLLLTCSLGAMSPGPSLLVVIQAALSSGFVNATKVSFAHAAGIAIWAIATVFGVSAIVINYPGAQQMILVFGGGYLGYIGYKSVKAYLLRSEISVLNANKTVAPRDGFFIAFLNPKTGVFFLALFSQFIRPEDSALQSTIMVMTAFWVDALWYVLVSFVVLHTHIKLILIKKLAHIDLIAGICFISIAGYVLIG